MAQLSKIVPHFWYTDKADEAARFYASILPNSRIDNVTTLPIETPSGPPGSVTVVEFTLAGQSFSAMSAGPHHPFNNAISMMVICEDQAEVDRTWSALLQGGAPEQCGWLRDKYGVSWQIVPRVYLEMMRDKDRARVARVAQAMMKMVKFDIAALQKAYAGG